MVVRKVEDGIQIIINRVEEAFQVVVKFAEQAWDVIGYVFKQLGVLLEELIRWLGFLFNWKDILATHAVFAGAATQMLKLGEVAVGRLEGYVNTWCDRLGQELKTLQPFPSDIGNASSKDTVSTSLAGAKSGA